MKTAKLVQDVNKDGRSVLPPLGWAGPALIVAGALAAYAGGFHGAFVFDDRSSILENPTIRSLGGALFPPSGTGVTVAGRPVLNLSFALNYAVSGLETWSYHALNLAIHIMAGLVLFGLVRRTLSRPPLAARFGAEASGMAFAIAGLWVLHPLQTESVAYTVQRAESLMGLFYLLTLYGFVRAVEAPGSRFWPVLSVGACVLGMGTKEVMVSAPLLVLLYDRTFAAGSFAEAWRRRKGLHGALAATWLVLALLMLSSPLRGGTAGVGLGVSSWGYALTQCRAILLYLRLAVWPHALVADYGTPVAASLGEVWPEAVVLLLLLAGTAVALKRRPALGFAGAWFFCILAPSSSVVPVTVQTMAEHRMYLPLVAVIALLVTGIAQAAGRRLAPVLAALLVAAGWLTFSRVSAYQSELALWGDTVAKRPENPRARVNLGIALAEAGRTEEAIGQYREAIRLEPGNAIARLNLCNLLLRAGRAQEAVTEGQAAVQLDPRNANARMNLGLALVALGRPGDAVPEYEEALRLEPQAADVQASLGSALALLGRTDDAIAHDQAALKMDPKRVQTWCDLALAFAQRGDAAAARRAAQEALAVQPSFGRAHWVLGNLDAVEGNLPSAIAHFRQAVADAPGDPAAREGLARALELQRAAGK
ncbi:MAG TPA: tetratricopeptide repeat protein [Opitutaceae bacterium]|nr:tetratricopeptide repeat protein [Opitutaceae bacterium]